MLCLSRVSPCSLGPSPAVVFRSVCSAEVVFCSGLVVFCSVYSSLVAFCSGLVVFRSVCSSLVVFSSAMEVFCPVSSALVGSSPSAPPWWAPVRQLRHGGPLLRLLCPGGLLSRLLRPGGLLSRLLCPGGLLSRLLRPGGLLSRLLRPGGLLFRRLRPGPLLGWFHSGLLLRLGALALPQPPVSPLPRPSPCSASTPPPYFLIYKKISELLFQKSNSSYFFPIYWLIVYWKTNWNKIIINKN